jgi:hypothetical protein
MAEVEARSAPPLPPDAPCDAGTSSARAAAACLLPPSPDGQRSVAAPPADLPEAPRGAPRERPARARGPLDGAQPLRTAPGGAARPPQAAALAERSGGPQDARAEAGAGVAAAAAGKAESPQLQAHPAWAPALLEPAAAPGQGSGPPAPAARRAQPGAAGAPADASGGAARPAAGQPARPGAGAEPAARPGAAGAQPGAASLQAASRSPPRARWRWDAVEALVVFGLGSLEGGPAPRYQLALALLLAQRLPALARPAEVRAPAPGRPLVGRAARIALLSCLPWRDVPFRL